MCIDLPFHSYARERVPVTSLRYYNNLPATIAVTSTSVLSIVRRTKVQRGLFIGIPLLALPVYMVKYLFRQGFPRAAERLWNGIVALFASPGPHLFQQQSWSRCTNPSCSSDTTMQGRAPCIDSPILRQLHSLTVNQRAIWKELEKHKEDLQRIEAALRGCSVAHMSNTTVQGPEMDHNPWAARADDPTSCQSRKIPPHASTSKCPGTIRKSSNGKKDCQVDAMGRSDIFFDQCLQLLGTSKYNTLSKHSSASQKLTSVSD